MQINYWLLRAKTYVGKLCMSNLATQICKNRKDPDQKGPKLTDPSETGSEHCFLTVLHTRYLTIKDEPIVSEPTINSFFKNNFVKQ
jgi:hypothetical protein